MREARGALMSIYRCSDQDPECVDDVTADKEFFAQVYLEMHHVYE